MVFMRVTACPTEQLDDEGNAGRNHRSLHNAAVHQTVIGNGIDGMDGIVAPLDEMSACISREMQNGLRDISCCIIHGERQVQQFVDNTLPPCRISVERRGGLGIHHPVGNLLRRRIDKENAVEQSVVPVAFLYQFMHTGGLHRAHDVYKRLLDMDGDRHIAAEHIERFATECRQQLLDELSAVVLVHGVEHTHNLVHIEHDTALVVVEGVHHRLGSEVGNQRAP